MSEMPGDKDVIVKADGLMRRGATGPGGETGAFPVLTDIIGDTARAAAIEEPDTDLAREIFSRVMAEVEGKLAEELERRLTQHLVPQVHTAVASALGDLHQELANTIGDAVTRALANRPK
jgi:hypothetical protein